MSTTIRIKRSAVSGNPPTLAAGELAYSSLPDNGSNGGDRLYVGVGTETAGNAASHLVIGGVRYTSMIDAATPANTYSTLVLRDSSGNINVTQVTGALNGNANTASKLLTARNINLTGPVTGTVSFDGSGDVNIATTIVTSATPSFAGLTLTGVLNMSTNNIQNLADPINPQDAATKNVDASRSGLDIKNAVRVATTANIALSGLQTIDGVSLNSGDRVLVMNQTDQTTNGIYVAASGGWTRSTDANTSANILPGMFTFVEEGTVNANQGFVLTGQGSFTIGTTALVFTQFSGTGDILTGPGLIKNGNSLDINPSYVGQTSIVTLGTVATGVWKGTVVAPQWGGTGVNNGTNTLTLGGNTTFSGAYATQITVTGPTNVTLPTSGTLVNSAVTSLVDLAGVGTITTGVWQGTPVAAPYGGTGQSVYAVGDILVASSTTSLTRLGVASATAGQVLQYNGTTVAYGDVDGGTY
jgi:uncharacterized cupin superfamily protein